MLTILRIVSALIVIPYAALAPLDGQVLLFVSLLVHYVLSIGYSGSQIKSAVSDKRSAVGLLALMVTALVAYQTKFITLVVLFAFHHAFNEVYLVYGRKSDDLYLEVNRLLRPLSLVLNFFIYFVIVRNRPEVAAINGPGLFVGLAISYLAYFGCLFAFRRSMPLSRLAECGTLELISLFVIATSFFVPLSLAYVVLYHGLIWFFYGLEKLSRRNAAAAVKYLGLNLVLFVGIMMISPLGPLSWHLSLDTLGALFVFSSIFHIMTSLSLSDAQPRFITAFFQPARHRFPDMASPSPSLASSSGVVPASPVSGSDVPMLTGARNR